MKLGVWWYSSVEAETSWVLVKIISGSIYEQFEEERHMFLNKVELPKVNMLDTVE